MLLPHLLLLTLNRQILALPFKIEKRELQTEIVYTLIMVVTQSQPWILEPGKTVDRVF